MTTTELAQRGSVHDVRRVLGALALIVVASACAAEAKDGGNVGFGGAQDIGQFRDIFDAGQIPGEDTLDANGFFNEHFLELPPADCGQNLCVHGAVTLGHDWVTGGPQAALMIALRATVEQYHLPIEPFADLIAAFQLDQTKQRYATWNDLLDYCRLSANPVGRIVLMLFQLPRDDAHFQPSDAICTALQLTNHLQDVRRDILGRNRIYLPRELFPNETFEQRLIARAKQGWGIAQSVLQESREVIKTCVERTWALYEQGQPLLELLSTEARPVIELLASGGCHVLHLIEQWNYETALHRPRLGALTRVRLLTAAWWKSRRARVNGTPA